MPEFFDMTALATSITAVGTLAIAIVTALMVRATKRMAEVSERTLKASTTPQVIAYLQDHFHDIMVPSFTVVLENIGQGTAQKVYYHLHIEDEAGQAFAKKYSLAYKKDIKIEFLPAGAKREMMLGATNELYDPEVESSAMTPFSVTVQYEALNGEPFREHFTLDLNDFKGRGGVAKSSLVDIEKSLRSLPEIKKLVEKLAHRS